MNAEVIARLNEALALRGEARRFIRVIDGVGAELPHAVLSDGEPVILGLPLSEIALMSAESLKTKLRLEADQFPSNFDMVKVRIELDEELLVRGIERDRASVLPPDPDSLNIAVRFGMRARTALVLTPPFGPKQVLRALIGLWLDREITASNGENCSQSVDGQAT